MKVHHTVNRHLPLASAIAIDYNSYGLAGTYDTQNNRLFTMCGTDNIILKRPNSSTDTAIADWFCYAMEGVTLREIMLLTQLPTWVNLLGLILQQ